MPVLRSSQIAWKPLFLGLGLGALMQSGVAMGQQGYQVQGPPPVAYYPSGSTQGNRSLYPPPYQPQGNYQQAPKAAPKPTYNNPYGQQPYSYPANTAKPQPKSQPLIPQYQYAPKPVPNRQQAPGPAPHPVSRSNGDSVSQEIADLKARQRRIDQRLEALETKTTVGGGNYKPSTPSETNYTKVQYGDSLQGVADKFGTSPSQIRSINHLPSNLLSEGQTLKIAAKSGSSRNTTVNFAKSSSNGNGTHVVQRGESLSTIASKYNLSTSSLQNANGIKNPNLLVVGQKLVLPGRGGKGNASSNSERKSTIAGKSKSDGGRYVSSPSKTKTAPAAISPISGAISTPKGSRGITSYRIEQGDTIENVARLFGTTATEIQHRNKLTSAQLPPPGEEIVVPQPGALSS